MTRLAPAPRHIPIPDGATCFECDLPASHMHHVVPFAVGGRRALPLCERCHGSAHVLQMAGHGAAIRAALAVKQARGEMTGAAPFGMRAVDGPLRPGRDGVSKPVQLLEIDPAEQVIIARARALSASGETVRDVVASLAAEGVVGRKGTPLALSAVHKILVAARACSAPPSAT